MFTPYSHGNQTFSDTAHAAAQSLVYPQLFKCDRELIGFERTSVSDGGEKAILDGQMAIDRLVRVTVSGLREPIEHMVQERFRKSRYASFRDITITEWNCASGQKSELYKLKAGIFLYGYFDDTACRFGEVIAVDVAALLVAMTTRRLAYTVEHNHRSSQDFVCLKFDKLHAAGVVLWHNEAAKPEHARRLITSHRI